MRGGTITIFGCIGFCVQFLLCGPVFVFYCGPGLVMGRSPEQMAVNVSGDVRVRGRDVGVRIVVWDWDAIMWELHLPLIERVEDMVVVGYGYGLPEEDIEDDILVRFPDLFSNVEVEIGEDDEIEVRLEPAGGLGSIA